MKVRWPFGGRATRAAMNTGTVAVVLIGGLGILRVPVAYSIFAGHSSLGSRVLSAADSAFDVERHSHALLAVDSATLLVSLDATCGACRAHAAAFLSFAKWAASQGVASRLMLANDAEAAAQFGRLAGDVKPMLVVPVAFYERLGILATPSVLLVDRTGKVWARWVGVPPVLQVLNELGNMKR